MDEGNDGEDAKKNNKEKVNIGKILKEKIIDLPAKWKWQKA